MSPSALGQGGGPRQDEALPVSALDDPPLRLVAAEMVARDADESGVEEELRARDQLLSQLADALPVGLVQLDAERALTFTNERLCGILGRPDAATASSLFDGVVDHDQAALDDAIDAVLSGHHVDDLELRVVASDGEAMMTSLSLRPLSDAGGRVTGAIGCLSDLRERAGLRRRLEVGARVDDLTSCLNRRAVLEVLDDILAGSAVSAEGAAVVLVDLDDLTGINHEHGRARGDAVLVAAADRIRAAVRDVDQVGRIGGDDFLVVCPGIGGATPARRIGERVARALHHEVAPEVGAGTLRLRASVGVAFSEGPIDAAALVAHAGRAVDQAQHDPRHRPVVHVV